MFVIFQMRGSFHSLLALVQCYFFGEVSRLSVVFVVEMTLTRVGHRTLNRFFFQKCSSGDLGALILQILLA